MSRTKVYERSVHAKILHVADSRTTLNTIDGVLKIKEEPQSEQSVPKPSDRHQENKENNFHSHKSDQFVYNGLCISLPKLDNELKKILENASKGKCDLDRKRKRSTENDASIGRETTDCETQTYKRRRVCLADLPSSHSEDPPCLEIQTDRHNREEEKCSTPRLEMQLVDNKQEKTDMSRLFPVFRGRQIIPKFSQCNTCGLKFDTPEQLKSHKNHYLRNGQHECHICHTRFGWKYQLGYHKRAAHSISNSQSFYKFMCHVCKQGFVKRTSLQAHLLHLHDQQTISNATAIDLEENNDNAACQIERLDHVNQDHDPARFPALNEHNDGDEVGQKQNEATTCLEEHVVDSDHRKIRDHNQADASIEQQLDKKENVLEQFCLLKQHHASHQEGLEAESCIGQQTAEEKSLGEKSTKVNLLRGLTETCLEDATNNNERGKHRKVNNKQATILGYMVPAYGSTDRLTIMESLNDRSASEVLRQDETVTSMDEQRKQADEEAYRQLAKEHPSDLNIELMICLLHDLNREDQGLTGNTANVRREEMMTGRQRTSQDEGPNEDATPMNETGNKDSGKQQSINLKHENIRIRASDIGARQDVVVMENVISAELQKSADLRARFESTSKSTVENDDYIVSEKQEERNEEKSVIVSNERGITNKYEKGYNSLADVSTINCSEDSMARKDIERTGQVKITALWEDQTDCQIGSMMPINKLSNQSAESVIRFLLGNEISLTECKIVGTKRNETNFGLTSGTNESWDSSMKCFDDHDSTAQKKSQENFNMGSTSINQDKEMQVVTQKNVAEETMIISCDRNMSDEQICVEGYDRLDEEMSSFGKHENIRTMIQTERMNKGTNIKCKDFSIHLIRIDEFLKKYNPSIVSYEKNVTKNNSLRPISQETRSSFFDDNSTIAHRSVVTEHKPCSLTDFRISNHIDLKEVFVSLVRMKNVIGSPAKDVSSKIPPDDRSNSCIMKQTYTCDTCGKAFSSKDVLRKHIKWAHSQFVCEICEEKFTRRDRVISHYLLRHTEPGSNKCCVCKRSCGHSVNLKKHLSAHCNIRNVKSLNAQCDICEKKFGPMSDLKMHYSQCTLNAEIHKCKTCERQFQTKSNLRLHENICKSEREATISQLENISSTCSSKDCKVGETILDSENCDKITSIGRPTKEQDVNITRLFTKTKGKYVCHICGKLFSSNSRTRHHFLMHHTDIRYHTCESCKRGFIWRSELIAHVCKKPSKEITKNRNQIEENVNKAVESTVGNGDKQNLPDVISEKLYTESRFLANLLITEHFGEKRYKCKTCKIEYKNKKSYKYHFVKRHTSSRNHWCLSCGEGFVWKSNMLKHRCTGYRNHCNTCGLKFKSLQHEKWHIARFSMGGNIVCDMCGMRFASKILLENHVSAAHVPEMYDKYKFHCNICNQGFHREYRMKMHVDHFHRIGTIPALKHNTVQKTSDQTVRDGTRNADNKPHECNVCYLGFENHDSLEVHKTYYSNQGDFMCTTCGEIFVGEYLLENHSKVVHDSEENRKNYEYICGICKVGFSDNLCLRAHAMHLHPMRKTRSSLNLESDTAQNEESSSELRTLRHVEVQRFNCDICQMDFASALHLKMHKDEHSNDGDFDCEKCNKKFRTRLLRDNHTIVGHGTSNTDHHKCEICGELSITRASLDAHVKHTHGRKNSHVEETVSVNVCMKKKIHTKESASRPEHQTISTTSKNTINSGKKLVTANEHYGEALSSGSSHNAMNDFECQTCGQKFSRQERLSNHLLEYSNDGEHVCESCDRRFVWHSRLETHRSKHSKANVTCYRFRCSVCSEGFMSNNAWHAHEMHIHGPRYNENSAPAGVSTREGLDSKSGSTDSRHDSRSFIEGIVDNERQGIVVETEAASRTDSQSEEFVSSHSVMDSASASTEEPTQSKQVIPNDSLAPIFKCNICDRKFLLRKYLTKHLSRYANRGDHVCNLCDRKFVSPTMLEEHSRNHFHETHTNGIRFTCNVCGDGFVTSKHLKVHTLHYHGKQSNVHDKESINFLVYQQFNARSKTIQDDSRNEPHEKMSVRINPLESFDFEEISTTFNESTTEIVESSVNDNGDYVNDEETEYTDPLAIDFNCKYEPDSESNGSSDVLVRIGEGVSTATDSCNSSGNESVSQRLRPEMRSLSDMKAAGSGGRLKYVCGICGEWCPTVEDMHNHYASVHAKGRHSGSNDKQRRRNGIGNQREDTFASNPTENRRDSRTTDNRNVISVLECDVCDAVFATSGELSSHRVFCSTKDIFRCDVCHSTFKSARMLTIHKKDDHMLVPKLSNSNKFSCLYCSVSFAAEVELDDHMKFVHSIVNDSKHSSSGNKGIESKNENDYQKIFKFNEDSERHSYVKKELITIDNSEEMNVSSQEKSEVTLLVADKFIDTPENTAGTSELSKVSNQNESHKFGRLKVKPFAKIIENLTRESGFHFDETSGESVENDRSSTLFEKDEDNDVSRGMRYIPTLMKESIGRNVAAECVGMETANLKERLKTTMQFKLSNTVKVSSKHGTRLVTSFVTNSTGMSSSNMPVNAEEEDDCGLLMATNEPVANDADEAVARNSSSSNVTPQSHASINNALRRVQGDRNVDQSNVIDSPKTYKNMVANPSSSSEDQITTESNHRPPTRTIFSRAERLIVDNASRKKLVRAKVLQKELVSIKKIYNCRLCNVTFKEKRHLVQHAEIHKTYMCKVCSLTFLNDTALREHLLEHKSSTCNICNLVLSTRELLNEHMESHNYCRICKKTMPYVVNFREHMRQHKYQNQNQRIKCGLCMSEFSMMSQVTAHFREQHSNFTCGACGGKFSSKNGLTRHLLTHTTSHDKSVLCNKCGRGFVNEIDRSKHVCMHDHTYTAESQSTAGRK